MKDNMLFGTIFLVGAVLPILYYIRTHCIRLFPSEPLCGPGAKYFAIANSLFFIAFGFRFFYLALKKYQQEEKEKGNEEDSK